MRNLILGLVGLFSISAIAQELPQPSPGASVNQKIGLTSVDVKYSRPSAKGRTIFGDLVPFNEMWRTGANANTTVTLSTPVNFAGTEVKAGTYSLLTIPAKGEWTIVLNTKTNMWGTTGYSKVNDVARVTVKTMDVANVETFTIGFDNITGNSGHLVLSWATTKVAIPITVDVQARALKNIKAAIAEAEADKIWRVYRNAASYHYDNKLDLKQALDYIEKSIKEKEDSWYSFWLQAEIMAELKMNKDAVASAKEALKLGQAASKESGTPFSYTEMIESSIDSWKK